MRLWPARRHSQDDAALNPEVRRLLRRLDRVHPRHTADRVEAVKLLGERRLAPTERAAVETKLLRILTGDDREMLPSAAWRTYKNCFITGAVTAVLMNVIYAALHPDRVLESLEKFSSGLSLLGLFCAIFIGPLALPFVFRRSVRLNDRVRQGSAIALGKLGSRPALAPIARLSRSRYRGLQEDALAGLKLLLPSLKGPEPMSADESYALARTLPLLDFNTATTVLTLLEESGTPIAIEPLRFVEHQWACNAAIGQTDLLGHIRNTLSRLAAREEQQRKAETLLRPSGSQPEAELLRATEIASPQVPPSELLLRPSGDTVESR